MHKLLLLSVVLFSVCGIVSAQQIPNNKKDSVVIVKKDTAAVVVSKIDTLKSKYVNPGKIAARRAVLGSLIVPGLGQVRNGLNIYRGAKIAGMYTAFVLLGISFVDNNERYHFFLDELKWRREHDNESPEGSLYKDAETSQLLIAKDTYRRNKEIIIFSYVGVYLIGAIDAYVDARLNYFDVGDDLSLRFSPTMIRTDNLYSFNSYPGFKVSLRF